MHTTVENAATQAATAAAAGTKGNEVGVDGDAFLSELDARLAELTATRDAIAATMERLAISLPGMSVSRGTAPGLDEAPGYFLKNGDASQIVLSDDILAQMAGDEEMFAKVKDMVSGLMTAGQSQNLAPSSGSRGSLWKNVLVDSKQTRIVEVQRQAGGASTISALTMATNDVVRNALDLLLNNRQVTANGNNGTMSGRASQPWNYNDLVTNSNSWRFEMAFSSATNAVESLRASQAVVSRIDIMIEQIEVGTSSKADIFSYMQQMGLTDPLVFDLGDEGINLTSAENGVYFDIKGDGSPVKTAWITGNNAFLYLDENGNGVADDANELFGDHGGYANGFEKLAQYDSNGDGVIDSKDEIYSKLRLWRDLNGDGINQENESMTLEEAGITSIDLRYLDDKRFDGKGNVIGEQSTFTRSDGSKGTVADAWLHSI